MKDLKSKLEQSIRNADTGKRVYQFLSWFIAVLIAVAGVFTASAGASTDKDFWWATPSALVVWGSITAIGATVNKTIDPSAKTERYLKVKRAFQLILNKLNESESRGNHSFSRFDAERYRILAKEDPGMVIALLVDEVLPSQ